MADIEQAVRINAKLYEMRSAAKVMLGDRFGHFMEQYQYAIRKIAEAKGCSELSAALAISECEGDAAQTVFALAAYVELVEPSPTKVQP